MCVFPTYHELTVMLMFELVFVSVCVCVQRVYGSLLKVCAETGWKRVTFRIHCDFYNYVDAS